jgi:hypothetical protein
MPIPGNTRPFDHPENRSIISRMLGQGAYRPKTTPPKFPPPGSGAGPTTTLPADSPLRQKFPKPRPATIPTNSPMTAPLVSPHPSAVGDTAVPNTAPPKTFQDLIPGPKNRDFAYSNHQPLLSQHLSGAGHYRRSQSSARLKEQLAATAAARAHVPPAAPPLDQSPVQSARMAPPDPRTAISPQHVNRGLFGAPEPSAKPSLAERLVPRKMAAGPQNRVMEGTLNGVPTRATTLMDIKGEQVPGPQVIPAMARQVAGDPAMIPESKAPATAARPGRTAAEILAAGAKGYVPGPSQLPSMNEDKKGLDVLPTDAQAAERVRFGMKQPNMTFSGTGRGNSMLMDKLDPARNREEILARENGRGLAGTATLAQAAADPNYNANGAIFGGAKLGVNDSGKAYFREGDKPARLAGGAKTPEEARARYVAGLVKMQNEGAGRIDTGATKAFVGAGSTAGTAEGPSVASRLKAGGTTPTTLTPEQLEANKQSMLTRLGNRREAAAGMRMENQRQEAIARANQPNPQLQAMMRENPELAIRIMALQQQGQIAQGQLGVQQQGLGLQGREIDQRGQLAKDQLAAQGQQAKDQMTLQEKLALARQQHEAGLQANNPEIGLRKQQLEQQGKLGADQLAQQGKIAGDQLAQQKAIADMENQVAQEKIKAAERGAGAEGQAKIQQGIVGAILADDSLPLAERLQIAQQAGAPGGVAKSPLLDRLGGGRTFAGGTLTQKEFEEVKGIDDPVLLRDKLRSMPGMTDEKVTVALNAIMPPSYLLKFGEGTYTRSAEDPGGWNNMFMNRGFNPKTGKRR